MMLDGKPKEATNREETHCLISGKTLVLLCVLLSFTVFPWFYSTYCMSALMLTRCAQSEAWNGKWWSKKTGCSAPLVKTTISIFRIRAYTQTSGGLAMDSGYCRMNSLCAYFCSFLWFYGLWWKPMMAISIRRSLVLSRSRQNRYAADSLDYSNRETSSRVNKDSFQFQWKQCTLIYLRSLSPHCPG